MQFSGLLDLFATYHKNEDTEWGNTGALAKQALNYGIKTTYDKFRNTETGKRMLRSKTATITAVDGIATLPGNFSEMRYIFGPTGNDIGNIDHQIFFDESVMKIEIATGTYTIKYIPKATTMVNTTDVVPLPDELLESACDYGLDQYYVWERNWIERGNNATFSERLFIDRMSRIWDNTSGDHFS